MNTYPFYTAHGANTEHFMNAIKCSTTHLGCTDTLQPTETASSDNRHIVVRHRSALQTSPASAPSNPARVTHTCRQQFACAQIPANVGLTLLTQYKHPMGCEAQLAWQYPFTPTFWQAALTSKIGQTDLVFGCNQGSLVGLCTQYYKSLRAAATICDNLFNIQTDRYTNRHTAFWPAYKNSSGIWADNTNNYQPSW